MVLIGHSMGGLVSRLQTLQSGDDYWRLVSREPLAQIKADPKARQKLDETFFFQPNPSIRRVVTIGTPHRGSTFSNQTTQWLLGQADPLAADDRSTASRNCSATTRARFPTARCCGSTRASTRSRPPTPIFPVMLASRGRRGCSITTSSAWCRSSGGCRSWPADGDGVVSRESAHVDDAVSEITVPADHTTVHTHPAAVLEVRRILLEHLADLEGRPIEIRRITRRLRCPSHCGRTGELTENGNAYTLSNSELRRFCLSSRDQPSNTFCKSLAVSQ